VQHINVVQRNLAPSLPTTKPPHPGEEILAGLRKKQKELPTRYLYDECGSDLFEQICELDEYYPTRTETAILTGYIDEIVGLIKPNPIIIELGSGSSTKTRILLDHLPDASAYLPVDISPELLHQSAAALRREYPDLAVVPITADFTKGIKLPRLARRRASKLAFFPGSTIGNFYPNDAISFIRKIGQTVGSGGGLLIGVDLVKDPQVLNEAYNDAKGVTAAFNLNMLRHINHAVGADFQLNHFRHHAFFNHEESRIEMHLVSTINQTVQMAGSQIAIAEGESILTEVSYKYTLEHFESLAEKAGFRIRETWLDPKKYFSVQYLERR
jgi:dimethylhistidine N-methyltransferase